MAFNLSNLSRRFSTFPVLRESLKTPLEITEIPEHKGSYKIWRSIFFIVCVPATIISYINASLMEPPKRPEFKKYPHLRKRETKFPWGDGNKTLFHNPHMNALPDGYEDEH